MEPLRHEFHLNDTQLGGGLVTRFTVVYVWLVCPLEGWPIPEARWVASP
jgi:hypothetical protein